MVAQPKSVLSKFHRVSVSSITYEARPLIHKSLPPGNNSSWYSEIDVGPETDKL